MPVPITSESPGADAIYELRVEQEGQWKSRRMSIAPLAEDSGSKSRCFKVIYDDIMVVKMPPSPPRTFEQYLESIEQERLSAIRLQPDVECITPTVSAILGKIPPFSRYTGLNPETFEEKCILTLRNMPHFQEYLTIGGKFAFFMNLSRYAFLGQVIRDIHQVRFAVHKEVTEYGQTLEDIVPFEERYGKDNTSIFFDINDIYSIYLEKLKKILKEAGTDASVPAYLRREWFSTFIAHNRLTEKDGLSSSELVCSINGMLENLVQENRRVVTVYKSLVVSHVYRTLFERNRQQMAAIIANLLKLLAILRKKGIAMRDLKPDNVFITGDIASSPDFLARADAYAIGLIDFETAVNFRPGPGEPLRQPMLSGTPSYATPSHLFKNEILRDAFGNDMEWILHIQDWQAVVSMIYNVVMGKRLAERSGHFFPEIMKVIRKTFQGNIPQTKVFRACSRAFWQNASAEFRERIDLGREYLDAVRITLSPEVRDMFRSEIFRLRTDIVKKMRLQIYSQPFFKSEKSRREMMKAGLDGIREYRSCWEKEKNVPKLPTPVRNRLVQMLSGLEKLKESAVFQFQRAQIFEKSGDITLSAAEIMAIMSDVVANAMYREEWDIETGNAPSAACAEDGNGPDATVVCYEDTVALESTLSILSNQPDYSTNSL